jgi:hypothetical protein
LGSLSGVVIGSIEAIVVGRPTHTIGTWILWTLVAWSMIFALVLLHALLILFYPRLSPSVLTAIAASMPVLFGLTAALGTLPAVVKTRTAPRPSGLSIATPYHRH